MKAIGAIAILLLGIGGGVGLWAIGSRLSTDAIGMTVGLIFGALPLVLLAMVTDRQQPRQPTTTIIVVQPGAYTVANPFGLLDVVDGEVPRG